MILPIIDSKGEIGEVNVPRLDDTYVLSHCELHHLVKKEIFRLREFAYRLDSKRHVKVSIYVSEGFMSDYRAAARDWAIESWVLGRSAWFFSYAARVT